MSECLEIPSVHHPNPVHFSFISRLQSEKIDNHAPRDGLGLIENTTAEMSPEGQIGYAIGRYGVPLAIVCLVIRAWTRRVAEGTPIAPGKSRGQY